MEANGGGDNPGGAAEKSQTLYTREAGTTGTAEKGRSAEKAFAAEDLRRQEGQKIDGAVQEKVSRAWGSKAINAHRRAMKKDRRAKAVEKEKRVVDLGGGASWSILPTGAMVMRRTVPRLD